MNIPRKYDASGRRNSAEQTRARILEAARNLFSTDGIDDVTIGRIAAAASVAESTVYAAYKSKTGILRELMTRAIFGAQYQSASSRLSEERDPIRQLELTAHIARTIYQNEWEQIGSLRGAGLYSSTLRELEYEFEAQRFELQRERVERLHDERLLRDGLSLNEARRVLWAYTSRDLYRLLVVESGWKPERFESWLRDTLLLTLVRPR